jgi:hypothetical protein
MKHTYIKYEKLSSEIKNEIKKYHKAKESAPEKVSFDESMADWFNTMFDEWLLKNYSEHGDMSRRKHFRLEVEIPIRIIDTLIESSGEDKHAIEFVGKIVNISRGGLYYRSVKPIEVSSIIKVNIELNGVDAELHGIEALAMVIRADKQDEGDYGIGIMFSSLYGPHREVLDLFILKNLSYYIYSE